MAQYIDKSALVAEIERRIKSVLELVHPNGYDKAALQLYKGLLSFTNSLEVKDIQQDYKNKYYHALVIAKDWYKHIYDNFTSVADLIIDHPDDWTRILFSLNEKEKLLSAMFPEFNNSEEWWNDFYNQFYEQNKDNPEYSFVSR